MKIDSLSRVLTLGLLSFIILPAFSQAKTHKTTYGWLEKVVLYPNKASLIAKLDSGAKSASLYAKDISYFQQDDLPWVTFTVPINDGKEKLTFKKPLVGISKIKLRAIARNSLNRTHTKRPVVAMTVCLGNEKKVLNINLADRQRFLYPMLLGRDAINQFNGKIDPKKKFLYQPLC